MSFYKILTPYYDQIFPSNKNTKQFLAENLRKGGKLLDVGAGTGNMALALAKEGYNVTATEPEEKMAEEIRKKALDETISLHAEAKAMQQLDEFTETYDGIYCIGNTLAHLRNLEEIDQFLQTAFKKLNKNGVFILQIVNFERVLVNKDFSFPVIRKENFEFQRHYEIAEENILFTTTLIADGKTQSNTIPLYPATVSQLLPILESCGFKEINTYGNFNSSPYSIDTPALIITAIK
ncbi:class I SAM-dependent methyltransferase [Cytobacillus massiliigabonensis]|uniref:class I SAM-dependent methyltransferase n=1 Tax=Cytobacillus massiliigabonensis TaxID=1871011 RepID=UPI000C863F0F|nr:class I SAM-dependent methyltransferase [Cytobacillus massiliigabonensis]